MVKKIDETSGVKRPEDVRSAQEVNEVQNVSEVQNVKSVLGVSNVTQLDKLQGLGTQITPQNQAEVMSTIEREAEKLFAGKRIPRKRQKTITDALKMAVLAATVKDEDEEVSQELIDKFKP